MSKTFNKASRVDAQSIDPLDLCIISGKALPEGERGPLDTAWDPTHSLHAHDLLAPLEAADVESVFQHGVIVPVEVIRLRTADGDVPAVSLGRGRVRKARLANIMRKAKGLPLIMIKFTVVRITDGVQILSRMIDENLRRKRVGVLDQIDLAKQMIARGASEEQAAKQLGVTMQRFTGWLKLEDNATASVREALQQDRLSPSAAIELAAIEDHAEQDASLARLLSSPKPSVRAAKTLVRAAQGKDGVGKAPKLRLQKKLLELTDKASKGDEFMQGAKAALRWILGEGAHKSLAKLLSDDEAEK
jgi:hypothetical protein